MTQPPDPIAFSQFSDDRMRNGDPDFDPQAAVTKVYPEGEKKASTSVVVPPVITETKPKEPEPVIEAKPEPETKPVEIVKTPDPEPVIVHPPVVETVETVEVTESEPVPEPENAEALAYTEPEPESYIEPTVDPEVPATAEVVDTNEEIPQAETAWLVPEPEAEEISSVPEEPEIPVETEPEYTLVPADERPPEEDIEPEGSYFIDPVPAYGETKEDVPDPWADDGSSIEAPPVYSTPSVFSVPTVGQLESGKYYLQIGAFSKAESVEREIARIERSYPLAVQYAGSTEKPLYRILVGPLNHGESGAMLQNFKTRGYKDAFIRKGI
jgi:hypothetical protein